MPCNIEAKKVLAEGAGGMTGLQLAEEVARLTRGRGMTPTVALIDASGNSVPSWLPPTQVPAASAASTASHSSAKRPSASP